MRRLNLVFDMDGLLIDSLPGLANAMVGSVKSLLGDESSIESFIDFDFNNPGMSRFEKIDWALDESGLVETKRSKAREDCLKAFDRLSLEARIEADLDSHVFMFSKLENTELSVLSNCDNRILPTVIAHHGLSKIFGGRLFGTPPGKRDTLKELLSTPGKQGERFIFISDSESDFEVAEDCGVDFAYIKRFARSIEVPDAMERTGFESLRDFYETLSS